MLLLPWFQCYFYHIFNEHFTSKNVLLKITLEDYKNRFWILNIPSIYLIWPKRIYNPITAMGFLAMFTSQLDNTKINFFQMQFPRHSETLTLIEGRFPVLPPPATSLSCWSTSQYDSKLQNENPSTMWFKFLWRLDHVKFRFSKVESV